MSTKLPWTRLFADKWLLDLAHLPAFEGFIYVKLRFQMLRTGEPLKNNFRVLSLLAGCSVKRFQKALDLLLETGHIIFSEDGRLWSLQVEEELNNSNENLSKFSERAQKAAKARWDKNKDNSDDDAKHATSNVQAMLNDAINNNINININNNKKNKNIILSKREIEFENLETNDLVDEPIECDDVQSEEIKTIETKQLIIHEQNNNISNEANNRWQSNEAMIEKLPSRKGKKVGKQLSEIVDKIMPAYFPEQANFFEKDKKMREKQEVESMLEDFNPDFQYAIDLGLTHDEALSEFKKFIRFSKANPYRNAHERDWQSAWDNWITHPKYGLVAKRHAELEMKERYTITCCKPLTESLAKYIRNIEPISSFAT